MAESGAKPATLEEENARLRAENERLRAEIEKLKALVEELRRGQKRQAAPFSKGAPKADPKAPGRKPGAAYGRAGHRAPPRQVDEIYPAPLPECCPACQSTQIIAEKTVAQYQTEIPRRPIHRRFDVEVGHCACCGKHMQGRHPLQTSDAVGAAASQLGPDAQALVATLNKDMGLSHGKIARLLQAAFGISLSRGGSAHVILRCARRCASAYREIQSVIRRSPWIAADETGWRVGGKLQWLHAFVNAHATLYLIRDSRGFDVPAEALGEEYCGQMIHDGWSPYNRFEDADHQQCNQHLLQRCKELLETVQGAAVVFPRQVMALLHEGFAWRATRDAGAVSQHDLARVVDGLEQRLLQVCHPKTHDGNRRLAAFLTEHWPEIFYYLLHPGLDATNWRGEQAMRPAVVNRKVWGGNRTENGARAQECLTSVLRTATQQGLQFLDFLAHTLCAWPAQVPRLLAPSG